MMDTSPQKQSSVTSFVGPVGHLLLGHKFFSLARSHFPAAGAAATNKPKPRTRDHHHRWLGVPSIPFAPLIDTHVFEPPPPPYSAYPYPRPHESRECLPVPHNTPERAPSPTVVGVSMGRGAGNVAPVGLGIAGIERDNGERFDGLGELGGGFRGSVESWGTSTRDGLREQVHRMLTEGSQRRRTRASEVPAMQHDVFYASVEVETCEGTRVVTKGTTMKIRIRRRSVGSPTLGVRRGTISSELKRTNRDKQSMVIRSLLDPFPSPGSSFIPPPVPGPHEFAVPRKMYTTVGAVSHTSAGLLRSFVPRFIISILNPLWRVLQFQDPSHTDPSPAPSSHSPHDPPHPHDHAHLPVPPPDPPQPPLLPSSHNRLSTQSTTSLTPTSSRPAPPSPAISRRASRLSRTSSRPISDMSSRASSRPVSSADPRTLSMTPQPSTASTSASPNLPRYPHDRPTPLTALTPTPAVDTEPVPTPTPTQATLITTTTTAPVLIYIRDYAFASTDPRFQGHGQHVPRANRPAILALRLASSSKSTSSNADHVDADDDDADYEDIDDDDDGCADDYGPDEKDNEAGEAPGRENTHYGVFSRVWEDVVDDGTNGWGGLKWGFDRVWEFGRTTTSTNTTGGAGGFPSRGDLDRNFGGEDDDDSMNVDQEPEAEVYSDDMDDDLDIVPDHDSPLVPGLYRALYAFEPEGTAEMRLDEDQLVRVIGRGGGVGWAVVAKDGLKEAGVHALVPESYLEPVRLDGEQEDG